MSKVLKNLWPEIKLESISTPKTILKNQAILLSDMTKKVLIADLSRLEARGAKFHNKLVYNFYILAPALNNYRVNLLKLEYGLIEMYPAIVTAYNVNYITKDESQLIKAVSSVFSKPETIKTIQSLYAQSIEV